MMLNFDLRGLQVIDACYDVNTSASKNINKVIKYTLHVLITLDGGHIRSSAFHSNTDSPYKT